MIMSAMVSERIPDLEKHPEQQVLGSERSHKGKQWG